MSCYTRGLLQNKTKSSWYWHETKLGLVISWTACVSKYFDWVEQKKEVKHELSSNASSLIVVNTAVFLGRKKKQKIYDEHTYIHPLLKPTAEVSAVINSRWQFCGAHSSAQSQQQQSSSTRRWFEPRRRCSSRAPCSGASSSSRVNTDFSFVSATLNGLLRNFLKSP